ncbi:MULTISPECIES: hypothetical protein [unclassified Streptomyces]|uniref:hypothetical protein n=1 Tax=unclassified Streptomyces TaxID=2593676 RepID=UPI0036E7BB0D
MTASGGRRRVWRRILVVWAVAVIGGGVLTLRLQASAEPPPPTGWYNSEHGGPEAPASPTPPCPSAGDGRAVLCVYATGP